MRSTIFLLRPLLLLVVDQIVEGHDIGVAEVGQHPELVLEPEDLLGVDLAQGYFVGRPAKIPRFTPTPISLGPRRRSISTLKGA